MTKKASKESKEERDKKTGKNRVIDTLRLECALVFAVKCKVTNVIIVNGCNTKKKHTQSAKSEAGLTNKTHTHTHSVPEPDLATKSC